MPRRYAAGARVKPSSSCSRLKTGEHLVMKSELVHPLAASIYLRL